MAKQIDREYHECECECDECGESEIIDSTDYEEVNSQLKDMGWINRNVNGEWLLFCSNECYKEYLRKHKQGR